MENKIFHIHPISPESQYEAGRTLHVLIKEHDDKRVKHKVHLHLQRFFIHLKLVDSLPAGKKYFGQFLLDDTKENIKKWGYPKPIESHFLNLIKAVYRERLGTK